MPGAWSMEAGAQFGDYVIEGQLGSGASGIVYAAQKLSNAKPVALKLLRPGSARDASMAEERDRFVREIAICIGLSHPNIVPIIDSGTTPEGTLFAAYERVPGVTLKDLLAREGRLEFKEVVHLMGQVLRALIYSHEQGVIHRDIKPSNIMVSGSASGLRDARVLDFGVAGLMRDVESVLKSDLTQSGYFIGTLLYSSAGQLRGERPVPFWDLSAWSLVFLECLIGQHPCAASGKMPWDPESQIGIQVWLKRHRMGALLSDILNPGLEDRDVTGPQLLDALDSAGRELNPPTQVDAPARRRWVCVGACRFSESIRPEVSGTLEQRDDALREHQDAAIERVERLGGRVLSRAGDRLLFGFGYGVVPREDDARRALAASQQIVEAVTDADRNPGADLHVHIGLHAGEALIEGQTQNGFSDVAGATPEGASVLAGLARQGEVVMSEVLRDLLRPTIDLDAFDAVRLPGIPRPLNVYRIPRDKDFAALGVNWHTPFVGRQAELERLQQLGDSANEGMPCAVVLIGEAGIGKSRTLEEFKGTSSMQWLRARCQQDGQSTPFHPIVELLAGQSTADLLGQNGIDDPTSVALLDALLRGGARSARVKGLSSERQREMLRELLIRLVVGLAEREPTVLVIEDLHWSDPSTLELVNELMREIQAWRAVSGGEGLRLMMIATARAGFAAPSGQGVETIEMPRLDKVVAEQIVRSVDPATNDAEVEQIVSRADGVPLYLEEITIARNHEIASDSIVARSEGVPPVLVQYLAPRLEALSSGAQQTSRLGAVLGREFDEALLASVSDRSDGQLAKDLEELATRGILFRRRSPSRASVCVFRHGLIRDVAYAAIPTSSRRHYHARVADVVLGTFPDMATRRPEYLVGHLLKAERPIPALQWTANALERLITTGAYEEAAALGRRAIEETKATHRTREFLNSSLHVHELLGTAVSLRLGYGVAEVSSVFSSAMQLCEEIGGDLPINVLWGTWTYAVVAQAEEEPTAGLVRRFLESASHTDDPVVIATANAAAATREFYMGNVHRSIEMNAIARQAGARPEFKKHVRNLDVGLFIRAFEMASCLIIGDFDSGRRARAELMREAQSIGSPFPESLALSFTLNADRTMMDLPATVSEADKQIALCNEQRLYGLVGPAMCTRGWARARMHEDGAIDEIRQGLNTCRFVGMRLNNALHIVGLAEAELHAGDPEAGLVAVREGLDLCDQSIDKYQRAELLRVEAELRYALGDVDQAIELLRQAIDRARTWGLYVHDLKAVIALSRILAAQGNREMAWSVTAPIRDLPSALQPVPLIEDARQWLESMRPG